MEFNRVLTSILLYSIRFLPLNPRYVRFSAAFESSENVNGDEPQTGTRVTKRIPILFCLLAVPPGCYRVCTRAQQRLHRGRLRHPAAA